VGWPEDRNTTHWLENRGTIPAVEISGLHGQHKIISDGKIIAVAVAVAVAVGGGQDMALDPQIAALRSDPAGSATGARSDRRRQLMVPTLAPASASAVRYLVTVSGAAGSGCGDVVGDPGDQIAVLGGVGCGGKQCRTGAEGLDTEQPMP
jgi:hypothetical protein